MRTSMHAMVGGAVLSSVLAAGMAAVPGAQAAVATHATVSATATAVPSALVSHAYLVQVLEPWPVLREGSNSLWPPVTVRTLQYLLDARGARLAVDGQFGSKTRAAVIVFQRSHGLSASGVAYPATWQRLVVTVRQGSTGQAVRAVQDQVNFRNNKNGHTLTVDGVSGRGRRRRSLPSNGPCPPKSTASRWTALSAR